MARNQGFTSWFPPIDPWLHQAFVLVDAGVAIAHQQQYTAAVAMGLVMARQPRA